MSKKRKRKKKKGLQVRSSITDSKSPTLSLCMIVKDEEEFLSNCLNSVKGIVDEMIIVDTGSSDRTIEIAEGFNAHVLYHPFTGDFSEARNVSIREASSDWILVLDADEEVDPDDAQKIRDLIKKEKADGIYFTIQNKGRNNRLSSIHYLVRLFRNDRGVLYEGKIHELAAVRGKTVFSGLHINHYGYDQDTNTMTIKYMRDLSILEKDVEISPDNPISRYYLARTYSNLSRYDDALHHAQSLLNIKGKKRPDPVLYFSTGRLLLDLHVKKGELDQAKTICRETLEMNPDHIDFLFVLARIFAQKEEYGSAVLTYRRYLNSREKIMNDPSLGFVFRTLTTFGKAAKAHNELGGIYFKMGNIPGAVTEAKKAIECDPASVVSYLNLAVGNASLGRLSEAIQGFQAALEIDPHCTEAEEGLQRLRRQMRQKTLGTRQ